MNEVKPNQDRTADGKAAASVNRATEYFIRNSIANTFYDEILDVNFICSRADPKNRCYCYIEWKDDKRIFPPTKRVTKYGDAFSMRDVYLQLVQAGATPHSALQMAVSIARESSYCGLAKAPSSSAKGLYQGVSASYKAVVSDNLNDHFPAAKATVLASNLNKKVDLKTAYQFHFLGAWLRYRKNFDMGTLRGYVWNNLKNWDSQYAFAHEDNLNLTWNDSLLAAVSCWSAFKDRLVDKSICPFSCVVVLPLSINILQVLPSRTSIGIGKMVSVKAKPNLTAVRGSKHGSDIAGVFSGSSGGVDFIDSSLSNILSSPSLQAGDPVVINDRDNFARVTSASSESGLSKQLAQKESSPQPSERRYDGSKSLDPETASGDAKIISDKTFSVTISTD